MTRKITLFAATCLVAALTVFTSTLFSMFLNSPHDEITVEGSIEEGSSEISKLDGENLGVPKRLVIPKIEVDAEIQSVGLSKRGNMAVPSNYNDVGWYRFRARPGEQGSAVLDGHYDNGGGFPAVFYKLGDLKKGDKIYIVTEDNSNIEFKVIEVRDYYYNDVPLNKIFNRRDGKYLNLITCAGDWIESDQIYDKRTVVFAEKV